MQIWTRRVYDEPGAQDGTRILVDRVWPRGVSKQQAQLQGWYREVAPSTALRQWFGHDPARWDGFRQRYFAELDANPDAVGRLQAAARQGRLTLVFGARDATHNNAVALREYLLQKASQR
jgi:uncharacterized protein YeaO (DUF488 family)